MTSTRFHLALAAILAVTCAWVSPAATNPVSVLKDLAYKSAAGLSDYEQERCKLDLFLPVAKTGFPTLVWFHGGALQGGSKDEVSTIRIGRSFAQAGLAVALVNYRLSPKAKYPSYIDDAAASVAWVHKNIAQHEGNPKRVFVGGHSAGGYLTFMIGLDRKYLARYGMDPGALAGLIPMSGQTMTHYTVREERGLNKDVIFADEAAPIFHVRKDAPAMLVLYADHDMPARAQESQYLAAALKGVGHSRLKEQMIPDRDHGSIAEKTSLPGDPAAAAILAFVGIAAVPPAFSDGPHFGVNLAGAEFGGGKIPGLFGKDYIYPTAVDLDYLLARGRTLVRLPFLWERMQHGLNTPLDPEELVHLRTTLQAAAQRGIKVIIEPHSYGRYHFTGEKEGQIIGSERVPIEAFADFWSKLAARIKDEPAIYAYSLMNEPHGMGDPERWPRAAQAAVHAIRSVDAQRSIIVPGDDWSSARRWQTGANRDLDEKVHDPQNNLIFEAHCYFDKDGSGTYVKNYDEEGGTPDVGVEYVRPFLEWCRAKNVRGFIGEYGVPDSDSRWLVTMDRFLAYLRTNGVSATYWSAGPWWGKDPLAIQPAGLGPSKPVDKAIDRPQMLILRQYPG
jgi:endoglucanase